MFFVRQALFFVWEAVFLWEGVFSCTRGCAIERKHSRDQILYPMQLWIVFQVPTARRTIPSCCSWEYSQLFLSHKQLGNSVEYHVRERCTGDGGSGRTSQAAAHWQACAELVMVMCCAPGTP